MNPHPTRSTVRPKSPQTAVSVVGVDTSPFCVELVGTYACWSIDASVTVAASTAFHLM